MPQTHPLQPGRKMTSVVLYCEQPILAAGLETVVAGSEDCELSAVFTTLDTLMREVGIHRPSVILLEVTAAVTFTMLSQVKSVADGVPIVLWVNAPSTEFVASALALGVRGFLRKNLPAELQIKCLRNVAAGDLWVENCLCFQILGARRFSMTRREDQLVNLLVQGLKNKEIAFAMRLCHGTVKAYLSRLFQKLGVKDRFELATFALQNGLVGPVSESKPARLPGEIRPSAGSLPVFFVQTRGREQPTSRVNVC